MSLESQRVFQNSGNIEIFTLSVKCINIQKSSKDEQYLPLTFILTLKCIFIFVEIKFVVTKPQCFFNNKRISITQFT